MKLDFSFLNSARFWQLFFVGLAAGLVVAFPGNLIVAGFSVAVGVWFGGSVIVRTADRNAEKKVEAAAASVKAPE